MKNIESELIKNRLTASAKFSVTLIYFTKKNSDPKMLIDQVFNVSCSMRSFNFEAKVKEKVAENDVVSSSPILEFQINLEVQPLLEAKTPRVLMRLQKKKPRQASTLRQQRTT